MSTNSTYQQQTEQAISDARGIVSAMWDEDIPALQAVPSFENFDAARDRIIKATKLLDEASDALQEFGWQYHDIQDELIQAKVDAELIQEEADATDPQWFAAELLHELRGRMMTDDPKAVVWWLENALVHIAYDDMSDTLLATAVRG